MTREVKGHLTLASLAAGAVLVGGLIAGVVDWGIKTSATIGQNSHTAALRDSLIEVRLRRIERRLGLKKGEITITVKQEGVLKRVFHLFW